MLVVDDNPAAREILQEPLSTVASRWTWSRPGKEAIAAIKQHDATEPYDIVFMDWRMPGMDGLQASRHIKSDETLAAPAGHRARHRVRARRSARGSRAAAARWFPRQARYQVHDRGHAGECVCRTPARRRPPPPRGEQTARLRGARILLAEDNEINQQIAVELLEGAGATVKVANNGREAVETLSNGPQPPPFDVVLMDLQMPEMDGYQATAKIRADPRFAACRSSP